FCYLGMYMSSSLSWKTHINFKLQQLIRNNEAIFRFSNKLGHRPPAQLKTLYNSKCTASVLYGAGVWGYNKIPSL
ncbi:hypothetical protein NDU88_002937, partial [Pleurodeles waltl]